MTQVIILDGYVDEPTCLGVPPYISPYPRYIAGAIWTVDPSIEIQYLTIDELRHNPGITKHLEQSDLIIAIAGVSVPGKYLASYPMSPREAIHYFSSLHHPLKLLVGPAAQLGYGLFGGKKPVQHEKFLTIFDKIISGDSEQFLYQFFSKNDEIDAISPSITRADAHQIHEFAVNGAKIVAQHPYYPDRLLAEIETYRGCPRSLVGGCSFCSEPEKGSPDFRPINDIILEVKALYNHKIRHFRLGNQPCIFSYQAKNASSKEFPTPNPAAIKTLFQNIRNVAPHLQTLHVDNANPGVLARYPKESRQVAEIIVKYHTSGDVVAFGVESVDPTVIEQNNLKATSNQVLSAVQLINDVGKKRGKNGLPELLPGLNFLFGLSGERRKTFELNTQFLKTIVEKGLFLRRINIRQVIPLPNSSLDMKSTEKRMKKHRSSFIKFKKTVSYEINAPLLQQMIPVGTVLRDVIIEKKQGKIRFGRQMGSYPLLIGVISPVSIHDRISVTVVDHGFRSVTAVPHPFNINTAPLHTLEALPLIGKKRAMRLIRHRPYSSPQDIISVFDDEKVGKQLIELVSFSTTS